MFAQHLSSTLMFPTVMIVLSVVIVSESEAYTGHHGNTRWWDHLRRRTETSDPYQRQYLAGMPKGHLERGQPPQRGQGSTTSQGHSVSQPGHSVGQGHSSSTSQGQGHSLPGHNVDVTHTQTASQRQRHHQIKVHTQHQQIYNHHRDNAREHTRDFSRDNTRDNVRDTRDNSRDNTRDNAHQDTRGRDNVGQSYHSGRDNADHSHHSRDKVDRSHQARATISHSNRDNVRTHPKGHHATGDNVGQTHQTRDNAHQTRDNEPQGHHTDAHAKRGILGRSHHHGRDNVGHHTARDNVGRSHQAATTARDNVDRTSRDNRDNRDNVESHRSTRDNVDDYTHARQVYQQTHQQAKGERSPQCSYSFVVNELDSSKCPMLLQQLQQQQHNSQQQQRSEQPHFQSDQDILSKYQESLNINKELEVLVRRIDTLENKLLREVAKNRELENDMLELENKVKKQDRLVDYHKTNISNIATVIKRGEIMQQKQMGYWKNVDTKLSGVMLDVVELHNRLDQQDSIMKLNDEAAKSIYVKSTGQETCTGVKNATTFKDCEDLYHNGHKRSGVYYITPIYTSCPIPVYCDMETPPGGWLVIQRRMDGSESFNKSWAEYRHGFGKVGGEHWIGNDNLFLITNQLHYALRVDLYDFYNSRVYAEYKTFRIDGERDRYMLHIANHTGTAPDGLTNHDKVKFSTPDQDHDEWTDYHCAKEWAAGWWFNNCWFVILNGPYYNVTDVKYRGISWNDWKSEQLKHVEMKIRPAGF